jgi:hypothetical protein
MKHSQTVNLKEGLHDKEGHILVKYFGHHPKWKATEMQDTTLDQSMEVRSL